MTPDPMRSSRTLALSLLLAAGAAGSARAQQTVPHAGMLRYPDVSKTHIVFSYANDLWVAPKSGGIATRVSSPSGAEALAKFSPDGATIAFSGNYDGGRDLYTVPVAGGVPERVTHHPSAEWITDWTADGDLLFFQSGLAGLARQTQIFAVAPEGGLPRKLPVPYGANGAMSPDGEWLAYTPHTIDTRTWKRYRGGMATDLWLFNPETSESRKITDWEGTDTFPMWHGTKVYYLSDNGPEHRLNIWSYDTRGGRREQVTDFEEYDCKFPSIGPGDDGEGEIVFQNGSGLYLLDLGSGRSERITVTIPGDRPKIRERSVNAANFLAGGGISSTGKRAVVEARGDIWTVPAEHGPVRHITDTSGTAERAPAWSPDGRWIAYFSDAPGEYELFVAQSDGKGEPRRVTNGNKTYFFQIRWAPDSEKLVVTDKAGNIVLVTLETGEQRVLDRDEWANQPTLSWSHDSRWLAYNKVGPDSGTSAIWLYDLESGEKHQVTSGFFNDTDPVFSRKGDYLYYASSRDFTEPQYEDVGTTFVYAEATKLIAVPLNEEVENPREIESDEESWEDEEGQDADDADDAGEGDEGDDEADDADDAEDAEDEADDAEDEDGEAEGDDGDGDEAAAPESPIHGVWSGKATGLKAAGMPMDELEFKMTIIVREDGTIVGSSEAMGESQDYDSVTFEEDSGKFTATRSQQGMTSKIEATLEGETLKGTWSIVELGFSGPWEATKTDEEPDASAVEGGEDEAKPVEIDLEGFEARGVELGVPSGRLGGLVSNDKGNLLYMRQSSDGPPAIKLFDITDDEPEEKMVLGGAQLVDISGDGKKLLVAQGQDKFAIVSAAAGQAFGEALPTDGLRKTVQPREEWEQIFTDAWRRHRDFFYVENMHGVDWDAVYEQYHAMLADAASREDVSFIISEMISELNVGHAYYWGGDVEAEDSRTVGMIGADFEVASEDDGGGGSRSAYRISRLYEGAPWDSDARNPLTEQGMDAEPGDYLIAVNGRPVTTDEDPWAAFVGLAGKETTITLADSLSGDDEARNERDITIVPLASEQDLRYRAWIEANRQYVEKATDGKVGYIYVPDTGVNGQNNLFRQFYGQAGKQALIIDERWNGGGQIPTRFIELLNRPRTNYWARRDGKDWPWPPDSHQGPKCMLINGLAGSGGDMFPWLFRYNQLGKLIGTRTWGGLVGISGVPDLIDGGYTAVPTFGFYETDGTWGVEGHGVDPDIEVIDDPSKLAQGIDPQLDAAIELMLREIETNGYRPPQRPRDPERSGMGLPEEDR
ncbi:MAG TPA: S41 family peptidase [Phycisphaerales bacterium]|nr:S41 family peptidase [Phycisphaerales bacterium]